MASGTLPIAGGLRQGALDHLPLARIAQLAPSALERHPLGLLDLVVMVGGVTGDVVAEVEADGLEDPHAPPPVLVIHLAEVAHHARDDPGLLPHLAQGGRLAALAGMRSALGERPHPRAPGRRDDEHVAAADDHAAVGTLALSRHTRAARRDRARSAGRGPG